MDSERAEAYRRPVRLRDPDKKALRDQETARRAEQRRQQAFRDSPAGRARASFERGDALFQFELDVRNSTTYTIPMWKTGAITQATDASAVLNSIAREGWKLVNGSFVFHETGSESRDKFMASGQHIAVMGTVVGYYLFERDPEHGAREGLAGGAGERAALVDELDGGDDRASYDPR